MYRIEVFCREEEFGRLAEALEESGLKYYSSGSAFSGDSRVVHVTLFVPDRAAATAVSVVESAIDLRRRENGVYLQRVEAGRAAHYRHLLRRLRGGAGVRPVEELVEEVRSKSSIDTVHAVLAAIASAAALAGLLLDNETVVIGAMLISPILGPLYALSAAPFLGLWRESLQALKAILTLLSSALASSLALGAAASLSGTLHLTPTMTSRTVIGPLNAVLALILGAAVALGVLTRLNEALIGVAVAAALIPPLSASSALLLLERYREAATAAALLTINIAGIMAGSALISSAALGRGRTKRMPRTPRKN